MFMEASSASVYNNAYYDKAKAAAAPIPTTTSWFSSLTTKTPSGAASANAAPAGTAAPTTSQNIVF